jgi:RNA polymerase sigma-70 factor, ECF subfamily
MAVEVFEAVDLAEAGKTKGGAVEASAAPRATSAAADADRLRRIVTENYGFVWRSLRRLGVPEADSDDGVQRVLAVVARRLHELAAGAERAFLFQTAVRVAAEMRRSWRRSRLTLGDGDLPEPVDEAPAADVAIEQREARKFLDDAIASLDIELAAVFVLFELEELTTSEIAVLLAIPPGTVSTRLRRAREEFKKVVLRLRADAARRAP